MDKKNTDKKEKREGAMEGALIKTSFDTSYYLPKQLNPEFNELSIMQDLGRSRINANIRWFYANHPLVHNVIDLHSTYPISKFTLTGVSDDFVLKFYNEMAEDIDITDLMGQILRELNLVGEAFPYGVWDDLLGRFIKVVLLDPDDLEVISHPLMGRDGNSLIYMTPDKALVDALKKDPELLKDLRDSLDKKLLRALMDDEKIKIPEFNITHLARYESPKASRGTGMVQSILNVLYYEQKLIGAQVAGANRIINPIIFYLLKPARENTELVQEDIDEFSALLEQARQSNLSEIVYWQGLNIQQNNTKLANVSSDLSRIDDQILAGLFVNKSMITAAGPTWNSASIAKKILISRYMMMRDTLETYLVNNIFAPTARSQMFYDISKKEIAANYRISPHFGKKLVHVSEIEKFSNMNIGSGVEFNGSKYRISDIVDKDGEKFVLLGTGNTKELILPKVNWRGKIDLTENDKLIQFITSGFEKGTVPFKLVCDLFDLDIEYVEENLLKETGTVFDYVFRKSKDKMGSDPKTAPDVYKTTMYNSLDKYYERNPDEEPDTYQVQRADYFKAIEKEGVEKVKKLDSTMMAIKDSVLSVGKDYTSYMGLGYNTEFIRLWKLCYIDKKFDLPELRKRIKKEFELKTALFKKESIFDMYWKNKFEFWASNNINQVVFVSFNEEDERIGQPVSIVDGYKRGMISDIETGFIMNGVVNIDVGKVSMIDVPVYIRYLLSDIEFKDEVNEVVFSSENILTEGTLHIDSTKSGKDIMKYLRTYLK